MKKTGVTTELEVFKAIETSENDEHSFYALCRYFDFIMDDYNLMRIVKRQFKNKGSNLYLLAGESLFRHLENEIQAPEAVWSDVMRTMTGSGKNSLVMFTKPDMASSVGRAVHGFLSPVKSSTDNQSNKTKIIIDDNGISLRDDTSKRYAINGRRKKLVSLLSKSSKPLRMKACAAQLDVPPSESFKISGDKGDVNTMFKKRLEVKDNLILVVSDGYSLNYDHFEITLS